MRKILCLMIFILMINSTHGQWVDHPELIKELKSRGVPVSSTIKFYKLKNVYQNMYTMNNGRSRHNDITPQQQIDPWISSGGMHHIDRSLWRNITALDLGKTGKIKYWKEDVDVSAFALVPMHRWSYPEGALAYDILINSKTGKVFEVRIQRKESTRWDDGEIYRPEIDLKNETKQGYSWNFDNNYYVDNPLAARGYTYTVKTINPSAKLIVVPRDKVIIDESNIVIPKGYVGTGISCNSCHQRAGQIMSVHDRIYKEPLPGNDGRFSWHPFDGNGSIDNRWPLDK